MPLTKWLRENRTAPRYSNKPAGRGFIRCSAGSTKSAPVSRGHSSDASDPRPTAQVVLRVKSGLWDCSANARWQCRYSLHRQEVAVPKRQVYAVYRGTTPGQWRLSHQPRRPIGRDLDHHVSLLCLPSAHVKLYKAQHKH